MPKTDPTPSEEQNIPIDAPPPPVDDVKAWNIHQRMWHASTMISVLVKRGQNQQQKYRFVSHDDTVAKVRGAFIACRILCTIDVREHNIEMQKLARQGGGETTLCLGTVICDATFFNIDDPEDMIVVTVPAYGLDYGDKAIGKALSYAKKYALIACSGLLLATGDDVDQDAHEMDALEQARAAREAKGHPEGHETSKKTQDSGRGGTKGRKADTKTDGKPPAQGGATGDVNPTAAREFLEGFDSAQYGTLDKSVLVMILGAHAVCLGSKIKTHGTEVIKARWESVEAAPVAEVARLAQEWASKHAAYDRLKDLAIKEFKATAAKAFIARLWKYRGWPACLADLEPGTLEGEVDAWREGGAPTLEDPAS